MEIDLGGFGFWLFLAIVIASFVIAGAMKDKSLHRLIEASIEKSGTIDPKLAEFLAAEMRRRAENDARAWGSAETPRKGAAARRKAATAIAVAGLLFGVILFAIVLAAALKEGNLQPVLAVLIAAGVGAIPVAFFGLIAWVKWPNSETSNDSEPLV